MALGFPLIPGVPAAGHLARNGFWHPGSERTCTKPPCAERPSPGRHRRDDEGHR